MTDDTLVVSIKPSTSYDSALIVAKGPDGPAVQQALASFFGFDAERVAGQIPWETFLEAEHLAKGAATASAGLGARPLNSGKGKAPKAVSEAPVASQEASSVEPEQEKSPKENLLDAIANAESIRELGGLFQKHKDLFKDPEVLAASEARSKEIKGA